MDQRQTPYADRLKEVAHWPWATPPGHVGNPVDPRIAQILGQNYLDADRTIGNPGLDRPSPEGVSALHQSEALAAALYGAAAVRILTTGTSSAAQAMMLAVARSAGPRRTILVQSSVHVAIVNGLRWAGAAVRILPATWHPRLGAAVAVTPEALRRALADTPRVGAVVLSSPSYEGAHADIGELARIAHHNGAIVALDQSWGAYFGMHPTLTPPGAASEADVAIVSLHKSIGSPSGTALMLLAHGSRVKRADFEDAALQVASTSPQLPLIASLDLARSWLAIEGGRAIERVSASLAALRERLGAIPGLLPIDIDGWIRDGHKWGAAGWNWLCLTVDVTGTGYTGHEFAAALFDLHHLAIVQATRSRVTLFSGLGATERAIARWGDMFADTVDSLPQRPSLDSVVYPEPPHSLEVVDLSGVLRRAWEAVPLGQAVGRIAAHGVCPYPPGTYVVWSGMTITSESADYLHQLVQAGGYFRGAWMEPGTIAVFVE